VTATIMKPARAKWNEERRDIFVLAAKSFAIAADFIPRNSTNPDLPREH